MTKPTRKRRPSPTRNIDADHFLDEKRDLRRFFAAAIEAKDGELAAIKSLNDTAYLEIDRLTRALAEAKTDTQTASPVSTEAEPTPSAIEAALRRQPAQECPSAHAPNLDNAVSDFSGWFTPVVSSETPAAIHEQTTPVCRWKAAAAPPSWISRAWGSFLDGACISLGLVVLPYGIWKVLPWVDALISNLGG